MLHETKTFKIKIRKMIHVFIYKERLYKELDAKKGCKIRNS